MVELLAPKKLGTGLFFLINEMGEDQNSFVGSKEVEYTESLFYIYKAQG